MGENDTPYTYFIVRALECSEFPEIINLAFLSLCFLVWRRTARSEKSFIPKGNTKPNMTNTTKSDGCRALTSSVDPGRVSDEIRVSVVDDSRVDNETHSPCEEEAENARLSDPCYDKGGSVVVTGFFFGETFALPELSSTLDAKRTSAAMEITLRRRR